VVLRRRGGRYEKDAFMTQVVENTPQPAVDGGPETPQPAAPPRAAAPAAEGDLVMAVHRVLEASSEPLTLSKIRSHLPTAFRQMSLEDLGEILRRRADANVLYQYAPYRSQQHRFWDRPLPVHTAVLIHAALEQGPLTLSQLRRKLPDYARHLTDEVVRDQVEQGRLHRHPAGASRAGELFALEPPDPRAPLRQELTKLFDRLQKQLGFSRAQLRAASLELLHEEEWDTPAASPLAAEAETPPAPEAPAAEEPRAAAPPAGSEGLS
jgi:hypothetical protein